MDWPGSATVSCALPSRSVFPPCWRSGHVSRGRDADMPRVAWLPTALDHDCGPACLAMVLAYHGSNVSIDAVREKLGTSRDGTTGLDLVRVARESGMEARGYRVENRAALRDVPLPLIAHYQSGHFVVLERYRAGRDVRVVDPVEGRRVLSA